MRCELATDSPWMDAFVVSHRSDRGRKYAYTYIDMGPSGYFEGFTLVLRSDLCSQFFPKVNRLTTCENAFWVMALGSEGLMV